MCRYPLGSGGKRVWTRPSFLPALMSASMMCLIKFGGGANSPADFDEDGFLFLLTLPSRDFIILIPKGIRIVYIQG
jgi:hypothetical protein